MEVRPGYKKSEVGVIPEEWECSTVRGIAAKTRNAIVGGPFGSDLVSNDYVEYGVPVIRGQNMSWQWVSGNFVFVTPAKARSLQANLARPGDIVFTQRGTLGQVSLVPDQPFDSYLVSQSQMKLSVNRQVANPLFFFYVFTSEDQQQLIRGGTIQTGVPHINLGILRDIPLQLPPLPEQHAIAGALSDVDALLESLEKLIAKKRDLKQATMQQLLTGKKRLPGFSAEWKVKRLGDVTALIPGGVYGEEKARDGLIPCRVVTTAHIDEDDTWNSKEMNVRYFSQEQVERYSPIEGDLIVVKSSGSAAKIQSGKIGFVDQEVVGRFLFSNFLMLLRPVSVLPRFLYFYLCSHNVKKLLPNLVEASTYPNIRIPEYLALEIPIPPPPEQTAIAGVLSDMDVELATLEQRLAKTQALKQGMMQELLTGKTRLV